MSSDENNLIRNDSLMQLLFEYQAILDLASWKQFEMRDNIIQYLHDNYSTLYMLSEQGLGIFNNLKSEINAENYSPIHTKFILSDRKFQSLIVTRFEANALRYFS